MPYCGLSVVENDIELCFPHTLGPCMEPRANSCPLLGQVEETTLFLCHCQFKRMPQGHLQIHHIKYLLARYLHAQLRDGKVIQWCASSQKMTLCGRKLLNIDHQSMPDSTKRQKAEQQERKATGLWDTYLFTFRISFDELSTADSCRFLQSSLKLS